MNSVQVPFVDLHAQHDSLGSSMTEAIRRVIEGSTFILGSEVEGFEREFAEYLGIPHAIGVGTGLDAIRLSLVALGIGPGDEVVVPANTFIATALAVSAAGATPVPVDAEDESFGIDPDGFERAIGAKTRAVIPVHLYGRSCAMDRVLEIAAAHEVKVVEDACQAHGARFGARTCGTLGDAGCFSFYPSKNLGAVGDGGMIVCRDDSLADRIRRLRDYGQVRKYEHVVKGWNTRLDGIQAAVLRLKLARLDGWNQRRAEVARRYTEGLSDLAWLKTPSVPPWPEHVVHLYVLRTGRRDELKEHLGRKGIQTGIHYPRPIHLQPAYADLGLGEGSLPKSERLSREILSLPMYPEITNQQVDHVIGETRGLTAR
ncbi:MAG: DegT/DnrJ/EryC1/StrS family aminotransferase [Planctomycetota bacterium]